MSKKYIYFLNNMLEKCMDLSSKKKNIIDFKVFKIITLCTTNYKTALENTDETHADTKGTCTETPDRIKRTCSEAATLTASLPKAQPNIKYKCMLGFTKLY